MALVAHGLVLSLYRAHLLGLATAPLRRLAPLEFAAVARVDLAGPTLVQDFVSVAPSPPARHDRSIPGMPSFTERKQATWHIWRSRFWVRAARSGRRVPAARASCAPRAREHGIPWARTGPSVFVHGPNVLIDTPEDSCYQVDRAGIDHIAAGFYSHWHPDHTAGRRMYETRNWDFLHWPPTPIDDAHLSAAQGVAGFRDSWAWPRTFATRKRWATSECM